MDIIVTHNGGFFSCCSVRLGKIVEYINLFNKLPNSVDSSSQFSWYKVGKTGDITYDYFEHYNNIPSIIKHSKKIKYHWDDQFTNYSTIQYAEICPIVKKYFTPTAGIFNIVTNIEHKYLTSLENTCVLFYRGNDKETETRLCSYDEYIHYANLVLTKCPDIKFLIQSDESGFIQLMLKTFPGISFYFKDEIRHVNKCNSTVDILYRDTNYMFSKYYLAITIIMSKCKYIICGSGNCSIWVMFFRGNNANVYQNLNGTWFEPTDI